MRTLLKYSALLLAAVVLLPVDGFAQARGPQSGNDEAGPRERAQVERGQADHDRGRVRDRDRVHQPAIEPAQEQQQAMERRQEQNREEVQAQNRVHAPDTGSDVDSKIYGHELMSVEERNRYREQLRLVESDPEKKTRFQAQHREQMQARAKAQGIDIDDIGEDEETD